MLLRVVFIKVISWNAIRLGASKKTTKFHMWFHCLLKFDHLTLNINLNQETQPLQDTANSLTFTEW